jgi:hypothetical protein
MAKQYDGQDVSFKAYDSMATSQFLFVKATSTADTVDVCSAVTDVILGVLQDEGTTGQGVGVRLFGHTKVVLGETVAAGAVIGTSTGGKAVAVVAGTDTTTYRAGICTKGGDVNEIGEMVLLPSGRCA